MRTIPDYSEWETLTLYFYRFLVRNSTNSYLSYYQIHKIYKTTFLLGLLNLILEKDKVVVEKSIHSHFPDQTKNNREENN